MKNKTKKIMARIAEENRIDSLIEKWINTYGDSFNYNVCLKKLNKMFPYTNELTILGIIYKYFKN